ncbi:MAG TPA: cupin domain-containing protein [Acidimicrobiales bacterium]|jgi:quercetin dioxygenase-like cupin family protein|nr:cupin domain-containing protein [Acidimicrobiales bacterium]
METPAKPASIKGPDANFTGDVWIDQISRGLPPAPLNVGAVHFTPGARTAWHSHAGGQTLYVTEGRGLVQSRGEAAVVVNPGDVVFAPDGEEHWHGATADHFMTHLTITNGSPQWGEHVSDEDYGGAQPSGT